MNGVFDKVKEVNSEQLFSESLRRGPVNRCRVVSGFGVGDVVPQRNVLYSVYNSMCNAWARQTSELSTALRCDWGGAGRGTTTASKSNLHGSCQLLARTLSRHNRGHNQQWRNARGTRGGRDTRSHNDV